MSYWILHYRTPQEGLISLCEAPDSEHAKDVFYDNAREDQELVHVAPFQCTETSWNTLKERGFLDIMVACPREDAPPADEIHHPATGGTYEEEFDPYDEHVGRDQNPPGSRTDW